jgi:GAF domain-containing protein
LIDTDSFTEFLAEVARYAADTVGPGLSCGITLIRDGRPATVAGSDDLAASLDEVQYHYRDGPCLTAMRTHEATTISDLATDDRWGPYRRNALARGARSVLSIPLWIGPGEAGALNLYSLTSEVFSADQQRRAEGFAAEASRALRLAGQLADQIELSHNLQAALVSRSIIDQALGVIMAQNRCTADEAFDIMRSGSSHRNIKLRDLAREIVTRVGGEPPKSTPPLRA